ncbi:MAG: hypothetical protein WAM73_17535 [Desulfobacterales bacterium]
MVQNVVDPGICSTCDDRPICLALKNTLREGQSVFHCEEFNASSQKTDRGIAVGSCDNNSVAHDEAISARGKGLCTNCNNNRICKLTCFGSVVIYCEEYS